MNGFARIITVLLLTAAAAVSADPPNVLLGKWKLSAEPGAAAPSKYCQPQMVFTAKTFTVTNTNGTESTNAVTYVTGGAKTVTFPTSVYMITDAGAARHTTYVFKTGKDRMVLETALMCPYARQ